MFRYHLFGVKRSGTVNKRPGTVKTVRQESGSHFFGNQARPVTSYSWDRFATLGSNLKKDTLSEGPFQLFGATELEVVPGKPGRPERTPLPKWILAILPCWF